MRSRGRVTIGQCVVAVAPLVLLAVSSVGVRAEVKPFQSSATATAPAIRLHPPARTVSVGGTGDVLTENAVNNAAVAAAAPGVRYDFTPVFAKVAPMLSSLDLAICHMEIPIGAPGERAGIYGRSPFGGNLLLAPYEVAADLHDAGYDRCSTASNHSNDLGTGGIEATLTAFDAAGVGHVGTARTPDEAIAQVFEVNGVRVAHLSYTRYSNTVAPNDPWRVAFAASVGQVVNDVAAVRAAGAEIVILSVHISQELLPAPIPDDRAFITQITAATHIDLVIEHGPHVIQPVEQVNGTWVFWSVGNFVSGMGWNQANKYADPRTLDGLLASVRFTETKPGTFAAEPTAVLLCNEHASRTVYPVLATLADPSISPDLRAQMQQCLARSLPIVPDLR